ncbi:MAG: SDR family oxidoreductase [Roseivirga sp.]|uniref:SDR family oxidoreductase n=1 Tax=Roseivirga sp. TaxID=1964215 RepID=UPI001B2696E1|nr:SDR family oxidoreductase [Roseivirga sp.]MBO6660492.1 SDR family oxidoreductase [Roseivirga sp.]MBO6906771.1 SDR family oxidoreductase [Roseivirga sp.]
METIIITGATGKIGKMLTEYFLKEGHEVIGTTTSLQKFNDFKTSLSEKGVSTERLHGLELVFGEPDALEQAERFLSEGNISPTVVIHNARSLDSLTINEKGETDPQHLINEYQMAVVFPYQLTQLLKQKGTLKNVIFIASIYGVVAPNRQLYTDLKYSSPIQYGVAKAAQIHLAKELAVRLADEGIRVNAVSFGGFQGRAPEGFVAKYEALTPMGGMLKDEEVIKPVDFLVGEGSSSMTGHNLIVDGGWTAW